MHHKALVPPRPQPARPGEPPICRAQDKGHPVPQDCRSGALRPRGGDSPCALEDLAAMRPVVNLQEGLERLGGNVAIYQRLLREFLRHYGQAPGRLRQLLAAGDLEALLLHVHALKGGAGNVSAHGVRCAALALEAAVCRHRPRATDWALRRLELALDALQRCTRHLDALLPR